MFGWSIFHSAMPGEAGAELNDDVGRYVMPGHRAASSENKRHRRIEMRSGNGSKDRYNDDEDRSGRDGVAEQRYRLIAAGTAKGIVG
jgi:hypothetical protein